MYKTEQFMQIFLDIFSNIQPSSDILKYIKGIFRHYWDVWSHNQAYSELCISLAYTTVASYSEPCHI